MTPASYDQRIHRWEIVEGTQERCCTSCGELIPAEAPKPSPVDEARRQLAAAIERREAREKERKG